MRNIPLWKVPILWSVSLARPCARRHDLVQLDRPTGFYSRHLEPGGPLFEVELQKGELTRHRNRTGPHPSNLPSPGGSHVLSHLPPNHPLVSSARPPRRISCSEGPRSCFVRSDQSYGVVSVLGVFRADPRYRRCRVEHQSRRTPQRRLLDLGSSSLLLPKLNRGPQHHCVNKKLRFYVKNKVCVWKMWTLVPKNVL